jgi:hypothetical protein
MVHVLAGLSGVERVFLCGQSMRVVCVCVSTLHIGITLV